MASPDRKVPDWLVERLAAGELPEGQARDLRAALRVAGDEGRLTALATSNSEILTTLPAAQVLSEIERRAGEGSRHAAARRVRPFLTLSLAATCAAGLAVFLTLHDHKGAVPSRPVETGAESIGVKGLKPSLRIHRKTKAGSELLRSGAPVRKGDILQLGYVAAGKRFGVIASIDARGTVTLHLPEFPGPAAALDRDGERALPHAYELDDSPGFERFIFVTSDASFATDDVAQALKNGGVLPAPLAGFELTVKKETP